MAVSPCLTPSVVSELTPLEELAPGPAARVLDVGDGVGLRLCVNRDDVQGDLLLRVEVAGDQATGLGKQLRLLGGAAWERVGAARMEAATRRRVQRTRHLARQDDLVPPPLPVPRERRREKRLSVCVLWH